MKFTADNTKKIKRVVVGLLVICMFCVVLYLLGRLIIKTIYGTVVPHQLIVHLEEIHAPSLREQLTQFAQHAFDNQPDIVFHPREFYKTLKKDFKIVRSVRWDIDAAGRAQVTIVGVTPEFFINEQFVLGNKRRLFPVDLFAEISLDSLEHIAFDPNSLGEKLSFEHYRFLQTFSRDVLRDYDVSYVSPTHIELYADATQGAARILCDESVAIEKLAKVEMKKNFTYDVRFKHCICKRRELKGRG